jgi:hypothetical protein
MAPVQQKSSRGRTAGRLRELNLVRLRARARSRRRRCAARRIWGRRGRRGVRVCGRLLGLFLHGRGRIDDSRVIFRLLVRWRSDGFRLLLAGSEKRGTG